MVTRKREKGRNLIAATVPISDGIFSLAPPGRSI